MTKRSPDECDVEVGIAEVMVRGRKFVLLDFTCGAIHVEMPFLPESLLETAEYMRLAALKAMNKQKEN
jgi:hypothetical protein